MPAVKPAFGGTIGTTVFPADYSAIVSTNFFAVVTANNSTLCSAIRYSDRSTNFTTFLPTIVCSNWPADVSAIITADTTTFTAAVISTYGATIRSA